MRADRRCREIEGILSLLVPSFDYIQKYHGGRKVWAFGDIIDGDIQSKLCQWGYHYPGLGSGAPEFSSVDSYARMSFLESEELYSRPPGIRIVENVLIPKEFDNYFNKIENLTIENKAKFHLSCH